MRFGLVLLGLLVIVGTSAAAPPVWRTYEDATHGWQLRYPPRFHFEPIVIDGRYSYRGASISNFRTTLRDHPTVRFRLPRRGVLVRFSTWNGPPHIADEEARLPLSLASFRAISGLPGARGFSFQASGVWLSAVVWMGPRVSERDRAEVARIVASFRPRPLEEGWLDPHRGALVLERKSAYHVRSVRRFEPGAPQPGFRRPDPFYLVRAPRGFYAISTAKTLAAGPTRCGLRFDPERFEFFCPNGDRWDRLGRVIRYANSRMRINEHLSGHLVTVASDGHVLVWTSTIARPRRDVWP